MIIFANSLYPDQAQPRFKLFDTDDIEKVDFEKKNQQMIIFMKIYPACICMSPMYSKSLIKMLTTIQPVCFSKLNLKTIFAHLEWFYSCLNNFKCSIFIQYSSLITLYLGYIGIDHVIIELCYKATILQRNIRKMTIHFMVIFL